MVQPSPAPLHLRLAAMGYDLLPVSALWFVTAALVLLLRGGVPVVPGSLSAWLLLAALVLVGFGYFGLSWRRGGQTIGMRAWRLYLQGADGGRPGWGALAVRYAVALPSIGLFGAGLLWSLLDRERRCWHDIASGTRLVRVPRAIAR